MSDDLRGQIKGEPNEAAFTEPPKCQTCGGPLRCMTSHAVPQAVPKPERCPNPKCVEGVIPSMHRGSEFGEPCPDPWHGGTDDQ